MGAANSWLGNGAWPSNRSCGDFARDVFRIAGAKTDKQKALAFYEWFTRCMMRGPSLAMPNGMGGYSRCYDPLTLFTSWGHGECTFWGWVATECLAAAGLKVRRVAVHKQGHTYYEVWYKGDDGVEQWHAFDPFIGWYVLNENGEVASCEQMAANPQLVQNPRPGHPEPMGHHPERGGMGHRHRTEDQLIIDQPIRNEQNRWDLQRGMQVTQTFMPEAPAKALFTRHPSHGVTASERHPDGPHCDITEVSKLGFRQQPGNIPYWKNYMWPTTNTSHCNEGRPVRFHGAGALRWRPLQFGEQVACDVRNARFDNGCLMPAGPRAFTEVWYHIKVPYLISWLQLDYDVAGGGGDICGFAISADDRRTVQPLAMASRGPGWGTVHNGQAEWQRGEPSVQGLKEFWLRVDMHTHNPSPTLALQALQVAVGFQHNMHVQPRLVPGANVLWVEAQDLADGAKLQGEWIYQVRGRERRTCVGLSQAGRAEEDVTLDVDCPSEILMTGVKLNCM